MFDGKERMAIKYVEEFFENVEFVFTGGVSFVVLVVALLAVLSFWKGRLLM